MLAAAAVPAGYEPPAGVALTPTGGTIAGAACGSRERLVAFWTNLVGQPAAVFVSFSGPRIYTDAGDLDFFPAAVGAPLTSVARSKSTLDSSRSDPLMNGPGPCS